MKFRKDRRREDLHLDLTPMIDVMFNLVLFLLLATTFKKEDDAGQKGPAIQVDLPKSSSGNVVAETKDLNVWVAADGTVFLDEAPVTTEDLRRSFKRAARQDPSTLVVIKADQDVTHGAVVGVMDLARNQGLSRLAIATVVPGQGANL